MLEARQIKFMFERSGQNIEQGVVVICEDYEKTAGDLKRFTTAHS